MTTPRRSGFTLIEMIAAIVILAVAVPPMLWSIRDAHSQRVSPMLASKARWLAAEKLEDLVADRHSTTRGYDYLIAANYPAEPTITGYAGFSRSVSLTETEVDLVTAGTGYMNVTVDVSWDHVTGSSTLSVATVLTDYP